ncbi:MAG TPA: response regulator [Holophagaceae bacterium]|nr:response regulator [Holophagaceae bacterium]
MNIILLVEDDPVQLRYLRAVFESYKDEFVVLPASDGCEALGVLEMTPVDLIVTDLHMPDLDGYGLLGAISGSHAQTPIIVTSTDRSAHLDYLEGSFSSLFFVSKPCDPVQLLEIAREQLGHTAVGRLEGVSIPSLLQMLALDQKTSTVRVFSRNRVGLLYLRQGQLINARVQDLWGLEAAYTILGWESPVLEIDGRLREEEERITLGLDSVLLESARQRDEKGA